jgi:hypothetical protein
MNAATEYRARVRSIEVRYTSSGESVIYPFQDKKQALMFQSLVTEYDVLACFMRYQRDKSNQSPKKTSSHRRILR